MFSALRRLRYLAARHRFQKMVREFDERISAARAAHEPVKILQRQKSEFVRQCLEGRR